MRLLKRRSTPPPAPRARPPRRALRRIAIGGAAIAVLAGIGGFTWWNARNGALDVSLGLAGARVAHEAKLVGFAVANVSVEGRERQSRQTILDALDVARGSPILSVDLAAARTRLEALPWVRTADVERLLPDTIYVRVTERHPLALWQRQGKLALVADDGRVLANEPVDSYGSLIVLVGDDAPRQGAALLDMLASEPALFPHVAAAVRVGGRRWNLRLDNGIDVSLPEDAPEAAWHKLAALDRSESLLARNILAVDLRLPDRLVVRLPPEPAKPTSPKKSKSAGKPT